ncbi:MAG: 3-hydroxybutyryl-CoA dehydrogenase [Gemmatimonadetes bacterium]|jgi:3-hydroxybutyryl-CoA dehydrogenase|nr:3-hydroxybutyryl-CoA dehydrogenase [Gemmatimonadota bacterium]
MGAGIAQAAATSGLKTILGDVDEAALKRARAGIEKSTAKFVEKGQLTAEARDAALGRVATSTDLSAMAGVDLVIEAITEDPAAKTHLFAELNSLCPPAAILASNTSSLSIGLLAAGSGRPDRFVGLHFFNPVPLMPLVEVIRGITTSAETYATALAFVRQLGKQTVEARDVPGFVVNLLLVPYLLDAVRAVERGVATTVDIDRGMALGCGHPMGPLTLLDFVGLDTVVRIGEIMFDEYREQRYAPPPLLRRMVAAGWLGRKSGKGFYDYGVTPPVAVNLA